MEQEKMKRARERDDETEIWSFENNNTKKRDLYGINFVKKKDVEEKGPKPWDSHHALEVFDFPWLKDGVGSKIEDYYLDFEDKFSSSLEHEDAAFNAAEIDFSEAYRFCEIPEASMADIPQAKMVENAWQPFESDGLELEAEDADCIWSFLLNQPLSQQQQHGGAV